MGNISKIAFYTHTHTHTHTQNRNASGSTPPLKISGKKSSIFSFVFWVFFWRERYCSIVIPFPFLFFFRCCCCCCCCCWNDLALYFCLYLEVGFDYLEERCHGNEWRISDFRFGQVILVEGQYVSYLPLCTRNEPVLIARCTPVAMPETRECVVQGATNIFTTVHHMDMKFASIDPKSVIQYRHLLHFCGSSIVPCSSSRSAVAFGGRPSNTRSL